MGYYRNILNWYSRLSPARGITSPPYEHVIQIGDPVLRRISHQIPLDKIGSKEVQATIKKLEYVIKKYDSVGMSAPQVGVNLRIFAMRYTSRHFSGLSKDLIKSRGVTPIPYTVFINPKLKILDYEKVSHIEGCESVRGYSAEVARYKCVEISGYDMTGEEHSRQYSGWSARIAQHEMDHLDGKIYTDIMDRKTLHCTCWEEVNLSKGKVAIPFAP